MRTLTITAALLLAGVLPASGEVRLETRPDGTRVMYNTGTAPRRGSGGWRPAPPPARFVELAETYARRHRLDPELVKAVIQVESAYRPRARSRKGAMGLMQLMPETARLLRVRDAYDPEQNIAGGTAYLRRLLDRFDGQIGLALAGYNAGPTAVDRFGGVPPYAETREYVERVLGLYRGDPGFRLAGTVRHGRPTFVTRDGNGRLLLTTSAPAAR